MSIITTTREDDTTSKLLPFVCAMDAAKHNKRNRPKYTEAQQSFANDLYVKVGIAYPSSIVYKTYRKDFVAIKVDHPNRYEKISAEVEALNDECVNNGIVIAQSGNNIIYRIQKA
jgi:hypothetical protein